MVTTRPRKAPPLRIFYVYATNLCNCACRHCWIVSGKTSSRRPARRFLSTDAFEAAVREAKPLGLSAVKWTGGEPTIHPRFEDLLTIQKRCRLAGRLETNGMEVTPALARLLLKTGVNHVSVSLDGASPATHDSIRGVRGAYRRALRGFTSLRDAGFKPQIIMTLMRENADELDDLLALAEGLGAGSVKLNLTQPILKGLDIHSGGRTLSVREILDINRRLSRELKSQYRMPVFMDIPMAFRSIKSIMAGDGCYICGIISILGLIPDGRCALCGIGENVPELVFGRAGKGNLKRIWTEHPVLLKLREHLPERLKGVCGRCLLKSACMGACIALNYYRSRDALAAYWFCEQAEAEGLFPQSRLRPDTSSRDLKRAGENPARIHPDKKKNP